MNRPRLTPKRVRGLCDLEIHVLETGPYSGNDDLWAALRYIRELRHWYYTSKAEAEDKQHGKTPS